MAYFTEPTIYCKNQPLNWKGKQPPGYLCFHLSHSRLRSWLVAISDDDDDNDNVGQFSEMQVQIAGQGEVYMRHLVNFYWARYPVAIVGGASVILFVLGMLVRVQTQRVKKFAKFHK